MYNFNDKIKFFIITICIVSVFVLQFSTASAQYVNTSFSNYIHPDDNNIFQTNYNLEYYPQNVSVERNKVTGNTIDTIHFVNPEEVTSADYLEVYTVITFCYKDLSQFKNQGFFNNVNLTPEVIAGLPWSYIDLPITKVIDINDKEKALNKTYIDINFDDILNAFYDNFEVTVQDTSSPWSDAFNYGLFAAVEVFRSAGSQNLSYLPTSLYNIYEKIIAMPDNFNRVQQSVTYMDLCLDLGTENNLFTYKSNVYYLRYAKNDTVGNNVNDLDYPQTFNLTLPTFIYDSNTLETAGYCNGFLCLVNFDITFYQPVYMCIADDGFFNSGNVAFEGTNNIGSSDTYLRHYYFSTQNLLFYKCSDNSACNTNDFTIENLRCIEVTNIRDIEGENFLGANALFSFGNYGVNGNSYYSTFQIDEILNNNINYDYNRRGRLRGFEFYNIGFNGHYEKYNYNPTEKTYTTDVINVNNFYPNAQRYGVSMPIAKTNATYPLVTEQLIKQDAYLWYMYWLCDSSKLVDYIHNGFIPTAYCTHDGALPTGNNSSYQNLMNYVSGSYDIDVDAYSFSKFVSVLKQYDINNYTANNNPKNNYVSDPTGTTTGSYVTNNNISNEINKQNNKVDTFQVDENATDCIEWLKAIYYKNVAINSRLQNFVTLALSWNLTGYLSKFDTYFNDIIFYLKQGFGVDYEKKLTNNLNDLNDNYIIVNNTNITNLCNDYSDRFPICLLYLPSSILSTFVTTPQKPDFNFNFDIPLSSDDKVNVSFGSDVEIVDGATTLDQAFGVDNEEDNWFDNLIVLLRISQVIMFAFGLFRLTFKYLKNVDD